MRPDLLLILLLIVYTIIGDDLFNCNPPGDHTIALNSNNPHFFLNATEIAANLNCQWNFTFPSQYTAEIMIDGWNMHHGTVQLFSYWGDSSQIFVIPGPLKGSVNESLYVMWPPTYFEIYITTSTIPMIVAINITLKEMSDKEPTHYNTTVDQEPYFVQFMDWPADSAIMIQSQTSGQLNIAAANPTSKRTPYANIFVYEGSGNNRQFVGTIMSLLLTSGIGSYTSTTDTLTLYRAMDDKITATLIVNDYDNMKNLSKFEVYWSPYIQVDPEQSYLLDASHGPAALTVVNEADGSNAIYLAKVEYKLCIGGTCPIFVNNTPPVEVIAGGMVRDYDTTLLGSYRDVKIFDDRNYPQYFPGTARTFILEGGQATIYYTTVASYTTDSYATDGRKGFVMSNNYPFWNENQNSKDFYLNSVDGNPFTFTYAISDLSSNEDAYLNFTYKDVNNNTDNDIIDLYNLTNVPAFFNLTATYMAMSIIGGKGLSYGTIIPYKIHSDIPDTTTAIPVTLSHLPTEPVTDGESTKTTFTTIPSTTMSTAETSTRSTTPAGNLEGGHLFIILICVGVLLFLILIVLLILCLRYRIRRGKYRKFWSTMSGVLPIAVKVDEWELGDKQLEIFEDKELGRGAFGIVYEGELYGDRPVDRIVRSMQKMTGEKRQSKVAVKRLPLNAEYQARSDFIEEINFMKKLGYHPHILGLIGCITATSMPLMVLDYCENGDLLSWVRKEKYSTDMKPEQLLSIAWQISDGLCYLKSMNLIHRDLAARNILLTAELVAKISDFGLCRKPENSDDSATYLPHFYVSRGGRLPVKWLAPESLRDFQFSFKTDLWSYGVILWEMYTFGDCPFAAINPLNLFEVLESGERLPQGAILDPMYKLMSSCWDAVPGKRTPIENIKEILNGMMTSSPNNYGYLMMSADDDHVKEETKLEEIF